MIKASAKVCCPECGSDRLWKDGQRYLADGETVQRWLCRRCGYRFSERHFKDDSTTCRHQLCVILKEAKKLDTAAKIKTVAGDRKAKLDQQTLKGKCLEFEFWLNKQGYSDDGCKNRTYLIRRLARLGANLTDPETVKEVLAKQKTWNEGYKMLIVYAYESFLKMEGLSWERPRYKQQEAYPFIPTEDELNQLISACGKKLGTFLQGLKDTGADPR